eukprot:TRINITY_DN3293_c0_g1_i3.p1 TRINITY_DN3293_c0_g1~~TRINITY_DN3293_c0_g1_i3.p1  ORF type:complete len:190 (-),score=58.68 TRINITY_DN3293_c0_g1_i3:411-950(-)
MAMARGCTETAEEAIVAVARFRKHKRDYIRRIEHKYFTCASVVGTGSLFDSVVFTVVDDFAVTESKEPLRETFIGQHQQQQEVSHQQKQNFQTRQNQQKSRKKSEKMQEKEGDKAQGDDGPQQNQQDIPEPRQIQEGEEKFEGMKQEQQEEMSNKPANEHEEGQGGPDPTLAAPAEAKG